jgi:L-ascorbate metabolism protein UlaG (beta-lactamase superfamily)
VDFLLRPAERRESDLSAVQEFNFRRFDSGLPAGLEIQWLGTAGFRIGFEGRAILIDPYLSRRGRGAVFSRRALAPLPDALAFTPSPVDAVLVGHTHFDHALDVPAIARQHGCRVFGSRSLANLMALHQLSDRAVEVEFNRVYEVGPFEISFVASRHSKLLLGLKVPADGELTCESLDRLTGSAYRCGQVYGIHIEVAGVSFYHQGSANLIEDAMIHRGVDVLLCGISGRAFTRSYVSRILGRLQPRVIVPTHYDDFFSPLDQPIGFLPNVNLASFADEVRAVSGDFEIRSLELMQTTGQLAPGPRLAARSPSG